MSQIPHGSGSDPFLFSVVLEKQGGGEMFLTTMKRKKWLYLYIISSMFHCMKINQEGGHMSLGTLDQNHTWS